MSTSAAYQELPFENEIAAHLESHGWLRSINTEGYDRERAVFPEDVLGWIQETYPKDYERLVPAGATDAVQDKGKRRILDRLAKVLGTDEAHGGGTLNVLRKGFDVVGSRSAFKMLQMPPADDRNPALTERYESNRLRVMQEVVYSTKKRDRIDLVLFCNGIPVATIELKTEFTQNLEEGIKQYRRDRDPKGEPLLTTFRGALVHFVVTDTHVAMTTKLEGQATRFLPFDMGHENGAGNPPDVGSRFFWEDVLERDAWLTILAKFIYVNHETREDPLTGEITDKRQIRFARFHQWRAVTRMVRAAREEGSGHNYLIQHSAGSGKTDSIAWTAHGLSSLHTPDGEKVFDTVIVIADRQILDRQLQDAVDQLVTVTGTFQAITRGSGGSKTRQLREALAAGVPIIGVTLQTFPYALKAMQDDDSTLAGHRFAVVADEAHSSQSGDASQAIRKVVYLDDPASGVEEDEPGADQDALLAMAAKADADQRISFFAFTATPKAKTLDLFGRPDAAGEKKPFDLYSMKQAIDEGFILDVLKNYTSYDMAARIAQNAHTADIEVDAGKGTTAYIKAVQLHPTNISAKVREIIHHFNGQVRREIGGRAKAMVVTSSRAAAVQYAREFERINGELPTDDQVHMLVAFSGDVPDPAKESAPGQAPATVTEASMNPRLKGRDLAKVFAMPDEHVLIVANKYQTGFDQPLLVAMYVDKQLSGIAAVQTLSRLNRTAPGKTNTYVLDFVNEPEQILAAFQEYYEDAELHTESDPDLVPNLLAKLEQVGIFTQSEVDLVWKEWVRTGAKHSSLQRHLRPAYDRFSARWNAADLAEDHAELDVLTDFRSGLGQYVTSYAFFSQILDFGQTRFEKFSVYADLLGRVIRDFTAGDSEPDELDVDDIVLTHYKLEKIRQEDLKLTSGEADGLNGLTEAGMAKARERERAPKSEIIEKVNHYLGDLDVDDRYKVDAIENLLAEIEGDDTLKAVARSNGRIDFAHSPGLQTVTEDAIWQTEEGASNVIKGLREMPWIQLRSLLMEVGLYERMREATTA